MYGICVGDLNSGELCETSEVAINPNIQSSYGNSDPDEEFYAGYDDDDLYGGGISQRAQYVQQPRVVRVMAPLEGAEDGQIWVSHMRPVYTREDPRNRRNQNRRDIYAGEDD